MAVCPACLNPLGKQFVFQLNTESGQMMRHLGSPQLVEMNFQPFQINFQTIFS